MPSNDIKLKSKTVEKDKLGFLGEDFQYRLVSVFMRDTKYFKHLERVIEQDKFTVPELRMITGIMKDYYHEFDVVPSYEILLIKLREKTRDDLQMEMYIEIVDKLQGMSSEGEDYTKELGSKFFIQQHFLGIAKKIIDICKNGSLDKFEDCQALIESAGSYSQNAPDACSPFEDIEGIFTREDTMTIPTGIDKLDDILNGGLDKGNIGLIIGPSGFGKVQPYDAKIVTPTGLVEMCDIKVGSKVIGADGKPHNVIGVYPHTDWDFYKVTFSDGVSTECGREHLWTVYGTSETPFKTLSLGEMIDGGLFDEKHFLKYQIPLAQPVQFNERQTELNPYDFGLKVRKGEVERISQEYLYNGWTERRQLVQGITGSSVMPYLTQHKELAEDIRILFLSLGYSSEIHMLPNGTYKVSASHDPRYIINIEASRVCDGQCIKVDAEDELYLTDDFIVTHNTSLTTSFGAYAATCRLPENRNNGFKVLQIVFEDKIADIGRKYASNITQVETRFIGKDVDHTTQAKDTLLSSDKYTLIKDNVKVMRLETNEYTATDIKNVIKSVINGGFYPDMVIVDYLDCIKPERGTEKLQSHEHQNITMRKFENYAKELNVALWLPTQSNREGFDADDLGMKHIQGSVGRGQIAQVVIGIGRQSTDISQNRAVLKIMKNRSGQAGIILNVYFNNGTSTVYCDNNIDFGSDDDFSI